MRNPSFISLISGMLLLAGCASGQPERTIFDAPVYYTPTPEELQLADIGPLPRDYEDRIRAYAAGKLPNPSSAQYVFREPRRGYEPARTRAETIFCWIVLADITLKDSNGEDAGLRTFAFHILRGNVIYGDDLAAK